MRVLAHLISNDLTRPGNVKFPFFSGTNQPCFFPVSVKISVKKSDCCSKKYKVHNYYENQVSQKCFLQPGC